MCEMFVDCRETTSYGGTGYFKILLHWIKKKSFILKMFAKDVIFFPSRTGIYLILKTRCFKDNQMLVPHSLKGFM